MCVCVNCSSVDHGPVWKRRGSGMKTYLGVIQAWPVRMAHWETRYDTILSIFS
jgi:hypothetical protein